MSVRRIIQKDAPTGGPHSSAAQTATTSTAPRGVMYYVTTPIHELLKNLAPIGYEDDAGFHYGERPPAADEVANS